MPKERSGRPRLDRSCDWEKYGYDTFQAIFIYFRSSRLEYGDLRASHFKRFLTAKYHPR